MCGIFGFTVGQESEFSSDFCATVTSALFKLAESRGKDASGLALSTGDEIRILKQALSPSQLMRQGGVKRLFDGLPSSARGPMTLIGHSRMETDGSSEVHKNNQPISKMGITIVHNGIIVNHQELRKEFPNLRCETDVDTEIIPVLMAAYYEKEKSLVKAVCHAYDRLEGAASIACLFSKWDYLLLASNNGSLHLALHPARKIIFFASEESMLKTIRKKFPLFASYETLQVQAGRAFLVNTRNLSLEAFSLKGENPQFLEQIPSPRMEKLSDISIVKEDAPPSSFQAKHAELEKLLQDNTTAIERLRRCSKCLLPETFPFIRFDASGVCGICRNFSKTEVKGLAALRELVAPYRKSNGKADCLVALSGGRDSTFTLHYLKTDLGLNPIAYTYDWGMVTDLARRNISRITGKLGVEHILISADIRKKRQFIRQNVNAWLKRPRLGTIPLFMAGDKPFFYYANVLQKQLGINLVMFGMNPLERTDFKVAFCKIEEKNKQARHYNLSMFSRYQLFLYYGKEYFLNPAYWNSSWADTLLGFASYYLIPQRHQNFFEYFQWDEDFILRTITQRYGWETAPDTESTWRIGDGTASFYNYIYYTVAGFTENDTFRSNQIRQGIISREAAFRKVKNENSPRYESIRWYCDKNGIDFERAIKTINRIPKLYAFV